MKEEGMDEKGEAGCNRWGRKGVGKNGEEGSREG